MPLLKIQTNLQPEPQREQQLLRLASKTVAELLGKPERYVMVVLQTGQQMRFAGSDEALAYLELKSIGLPAERTAEFSAALCELVSSTIPIAPDRIYIEFSDAPRHLWGWNGTTFA